MKRRTLLLILVCIAPFILGAICMVAHGVHERSDDITVVYWTHEDDARTALEEDLIAQFEAIHPDVHIIRQVKTTSEMLDLIPRAFAAGQGPDLFNLPLESIGHLLAKGYVAPLEASEVGYHSDDEIRDTYVDGVFEPVSMDGKIYGMPLEYTNWCLYLNTKRFDECALDAKKDFPRTWEDVLRLSLRMVERDGTILKKRGFDFRYPYYLNFLVPMVEQLGGCLVSEDGREAIVGESAWIELLSFMQEWGPGGLNLGSPTYRNSRFCFVGEEATTAMALSGIYQQSRMAQSDKAFFEDGNWMVVPFPQFEKRKREATACTYAHYLMVKSSASLAVQKASWRFVGFLLAHEEQYLLQTGLLMPSKRMLSSKALGEVPYHELFISDMQKSKPAYWGPVSSAMQDLLAMAVKRVMLEGMEPAKAYRMLKSSAQELLDESSR